jgi:hypothetical protein
MAMQPMHAHQDARLTFVRAPMQQLELLRAAELLGGKISARACLQSQADSRSQITIAASVTIAR